MCIQICLLSASGVVYSEAAQASVPGRETSLLASSDKTLTALEEGGGLGFNPRTRANFSSTVKLY